MTRLRVLTRKHVTLRRIVKHGKAASELLGPDGRVIEAFSVFSDHLTSGRKNTRKRYCSSVADFYDYYFEACHHLLLLSASDNLSKSQLSEIIGSWREYLVMGGDSGRELASAIDETLPSPRVLQTTANNKHAALGRFLKLSEKIRADTLTLVQLGLTSDLVDPSPLLSDFGRHVRIDRTVRAAMKKSSVLAGVIAGGPIEIRAPVFKMVDVDQFDNRNIFPLDAFDDFCKGLYTARDKAIYSLYAASGCRSGEGLQILWEDIDFENRHIRLIDPALRPNHPSYLSLSVSDRDKL